MIARHCSPLVLLPISSWGLIASLSIKHLILSRRVIIGECLILEVRDRSRSMWDFGRHRRWWYHRWYSLWDGSSVTMYRLELNLRILLMVVFNRIGSFSVRKVPIQSVNSSLQASWVVFRGWW